MTIKYGRSCNNAAKEGISRREPRCCSETVGFSFLFKIVAGKSPQILWKDVVVECFVIDQFLEGQHVDIPVSCKHQVLNAMDGVVMFVEISAQVSDGQHCMFDVVRDTLQYCSAGLSQLVGGTRSNVGDVRRYQEQR